MILVPAVQKHREHEGELRSYCIEAWVNDTWKQVQKGKLSSSYEPKRIAFLHDVYTDRIRFTALDTFSAPGKSCEAHPHVHDDFDAACRGYQKCYAFALSE